MAETDEGSRNPYSAPRAELRDPSQARGSAPPFYAMSPRKLAVMSVLTLNIYDFCFWWRQWRARRQNGDDVSVLWRTLFAPFTAFGFTNKVKAALIRNDLPVSELLGLLPGLYLTCHIIGNGISRLPGFDLIAMSVGAAVVMARAWLLAELQKTINRVLSAERYEGTFNQGGSAGTYLVAAVGVLVWLLAGYGALVPSAEDAVW